MLLVDSFEAKNHPEILTMLSQHVEVDVSSMNQSPGSTLIFPDFVVMGGSKIVGINRKVVGEWLGNSDKVLDQVQRELAGPIDHLVLLIEGVMVPKAGGGMWSYQVDWINARPYQSLQRENPNGFVTFRRQPFVINQKHSQNEQTRLEFMGVQVVHTYSLEDTVSKLVAFHDLVINDTPNTVLNRLIKPEVHAVGLTPQETKFARQLMAFDGIGEEVALTIAASFGNIMELIEYWSSGGTIADTMLRSGTRRIGNALENKLQSAIGWSASIPDGLSVLQT